MRASLKKFKKCHLHGYEHLPGGPFVFREINAQNGYDMDTDIVMDYIQFCDGYTVFAVIPELMGFSEDFAAQYAEDLFSQEAFEYLFVHIETYIKQFPRWLYREDLSQEKYMIHYGLDNRDNVDLTKIQDATVRLPAGRLRRNITNEYHKLAPDGMYFGTLIRRKIVSIAGTNGKGSEVVDIGVETHPDFRRRGYAASNILALADALLRTGRAVNYSCNNLNINSNKTALSCGFQKIAREKTIWCPRT